MQRRQGKSRSSREGITPYSMIQSLRSPRSSSSFTTSDKTSVRAQNVPILQVVCSFSDAKAAEDQIKNIVGRSRARNFIQRTQPVIKIQQHHFMRNILSHGSPCGLQRRDRVLSSLLLTSARD